MLTIRLALYIFYNTVQPIGIDSSHALRAGDVCIGKINLARRLVKIHASRSLFCEEVTTDFEKSKNYS